jgi:exopolysaccharide biosynthesis glucuronosyltransferase PssE
MIFLTLGTQLPFDRLVKAVDEWSLANPSTEIFGQIATSNSDHYLPKNFSWKDFVDPQEYKNLYEKADLIVAHAGMGSIITAMTNAKKILIMPRSAQLNEHRNDHQLATADRFKDRDGIYVAENEQVLPSYLSKLTCAGENDAFQKLSDFADQTLIDAISDFIHKKS